MPDQPGLPASLTALTSARSTTPRSPASPARHLRAAAPDRRGGPRRRRRRRRPVRHRGELPPGRPVRSRRTSARPPGCCAPTTRSWTSPRSPCSRSPTPATSPPTRSTSTRRSPDRARRARRCDSGASSCSTLGGDHTIALPLLRAMHEMHGPIAVVHFDAHLDTWDTYFGAPFTHGTPFRRASRGGPARQDRPACTSASGGRSTARGPRRRQGARLRGRPRRRDRRHRRRGVDRADPGPRRRPTGLRLASTSTCSTRPSRPARARPRPAA